MVAYIPFTQRLATSISDLIGLPGSSYVSAIGIIQDVVFVASNAEFSKMFIHGQGNVSHNRFNYRINKEVLKLILNSPQFIWGSENHDLYLCIEEVSDEDTVSIVLYLQTLNQEVLKAAIAADKARVERRTYFEVLQAVPRYINTIRVPKGVDYTINQIGRWYAAVKTSSVKKYDFFFRRYLKELLEVSKVFKTGACVKDGLFYIDNSKTAIQAYKVTDYSGPDMLMSNSCIATLDKFVGGQQSGAYLFYVDEYTGVLDGYGMVLLWKTLRFQTDPSLEELNRQKYKAVFEYELETFTKIFRNIVLTKVSQIDCEIRFGTSELWVRDGTKGEYKFYLDGECLRDREDIAESYKLDMKVMKGIFGISLNYNTIRFFVYDHFFRIDFVNRVEDEEEDSSVDTSNRIIVLFGRCE